MSEIQGASADATSSPTEEAGGHPENTTYPSLADSVPSDYSPVVIETPLPKLQLFLLLYLQLAEPITSTVIYPFVNQLVRETGVTRGDERKTGYFAGLIESSFYAVEAICVLQWGRLSDRIGRKPVLLGGLLGLTLSMIGFGVSRQYWALVLSRCAEGALNGNIGVSKSMMAEITDPTNRAQGFAFLPMVWALGSTVGPIIGGVFSRPADRWAAFRGSAFWRTYPYFLPCLITACISISAFTFALLGLKETLPRPLRYKESCSPPADPEKRADASDTTELRSTQLTSLNIFKDEKVEVVASNTGALHDRSETQTVGIRTILVPRVLWPLVNYAFLALMDQCVVVLVPLMYSTSIPVGGLGFSSFTIGVIQGVAGFLGGVTQVFTFPWMHRKLGSKWLYTLSYALFVIVFALFPLLSFVTKRVEKVGAATWVLIVLQFAVYVCTYMTWGCMFMYISDGAPNRRALGLTNGLAQTTASTVRAIAPAASSSLFSVSLEKNLAGGTLVYWVLCAITIIGLVATRRLPRKLLTDANPST